MPSPPPSKAANTIAFVGCGFVADFYQRTLANHPELTLAGVFDRDPERLQAFSRYHAVHAYDSLEALLADDRIDIVLNLTTPESHYLVTKACLNAKKHVYSEKPLATDFQEAKELVDLAKSASVHLSSAPCNVLGEAAQTLWKALREGAIGPVYLAYAALDNDLKHRQGYRHWISQSGAPWPAINEFNTGCTIEHAGYLLTWLLAFFGPARKITSFSSCLVQDKQTDRALEVNAPDFSVGCIEFESGVVARVTNSIVATRDRGVKIFGEEGVLSVSDVWDYAAPVTVQRTWVPSNVQRILRGVRRRLFKPRRPRRQELFDETVELPPEQAVTFEGHPMDFMRGVAELAEAIAEGRPSRLSAELSLHVTELTLALQYPEAMGVSRTLESTFDPIDPMDWAR